MSNKGKYYIGNVKDFSEYRGFCMGHFIDGEKFPLLKTDKLEFAWKVFDKCVSEENPYRHFHKECIEVDIVIAGWIDVEIEGQVHRFEKGQFYVVYPYTKTKDVKSALGTEMIIIKVPSIEGDKYRV